MAQVAIAKNITTLNEVEAQFHLRRTEDELFFRESFEGLPELTSQEQAALDQIKARYRYQSADGPLAEGAVNLIVVSRLLELAGFAVNLIVVSRLLELAGFYDPPFKIRAEVSIEVTIEAEDKIFRGRLDFLVIQAQLWIVLVESKSSSLNAELALPQTLAYMMANPYPDRPLFGMVTNGGEFFFIKLTQQDIPQYDVSRVFSLLPRRNELYDVLKILKLLGQLIEPR